MEGEDVGGISERSVGAVSRQLLCDDRRGIARGGGGRVGGGWGGYGGGGRGGGAGTAFQGPEVSAMTSELDGGGECAPKAKVSRPALLLTFRSLAIGTKVPACVSP